VQVVAPGAVNAKSCLGTLERAKRMYQVVIDARAVETVGKKAAQRELTTNSLRQQPDQDSLFSDLCE
jgi:hypothetical protein